MFCDSTAIQPLACQALEGMFPLMGQQIPAEPKKFSQSFVPLLSGIREAQQENGKRFCGFHRFPVDQLAGFGSHLPMNVVQTVAGAVKP